MSIPSYVRQRQSWAILAIAVAMFWCFSPSAKAIDRMVATTQQFSAALAAAQPGDFISLAPGVYDGGHFRAGLTGVTIRSQDSSNAAIIRGGLNGIQLSDAINVTLEHLVFEQQTGNGINIDDGGSFSSPSTDITLRHLTVRDMNATGNNDGIKLSGVTGFTIEDVNVTNWGAGGSAIDPVGSHHGLIQNSSFISSVATGGSAVRPKGGSKDITIRANFVSMFNSNQQNMSGVGRAIQAGGSTGTPFFRFIDGDSGYEAAEIRVEGNTIFGGSSAISWVNIDGGVFHRNYIQRPEDWAFRLLNENVGKPIVETQNGQMHDNIVVYQGDSWRRAGNYDGAGVQEQAFSFARNRWVNEDDPTPSGSTPELPASEVDGVYGGAVPSLVQVWDFGWGVWVVNSSLQQADIAIANHQSLLLAAPAANARFDPLQADPLTGDWTFTPAETSYDVEAIRQLVLVQPNASAAIPNLAGDFNRSGAVDHADYLLWKQQFGFSGSVLADGNGDGAVNLADYTLWRDNLGAAFAVSPGAAGALQVAEPASSQAALLAIAVCLISAVYNKIFRCRETFDT